MEAAGDDGLTRLEGEVVSGVGEGAFFVALPWFRDAVRRVTGFDPYPGTLNVRLLDDEARHRWRTVRDGAAVPVSPPAPPDCGGRLVRVRLDDGAAAAVVMPDVTRYGEEVLEVLAPGHLRTRLGLRDGDRISLTILVGSR